jgi:hypothetical protein
MKRFLFFALFALTITGPVLARKHKPPKPPTQPDFSQGCLTASRIYSHGLSIFSGVGAPEPGLQATIHNHCNTAVVAFLTMAYFDGRGVQFSSGIESMTVAPGADFAFYHTAQVYDLDRGRLKLVKIIGATVSPL